MDADLAEVVRSELQSQIEPLRRRVEHLIGECLAPFQRRLEHLQSQLAGIQESFPSRRSRTVPSILAPAPGMFSVGGDSGTTQSEFKCSFISWNTQKRPVGRLRHVLKDLRRRYGDNIFVSLQEVPRWGVCSHYGLAVPRRFQQ